MTSWSLRPASRARKAPALWMPSWELPASRITASLMLSGRRSARSEGGEEEAEEAEDARGAVASSLLFGALVSGVVEVSFTQKTHYQKLGANPPTMSEKLSAKPMRRNGDCRRRPRADASGTWQQRLRPRSPPANVRNGKRQVDSARSSH